MPKPQQTLHTAEENEDIQMIAYEHGIKDWPQVYNHPRNAALKQKRPNPYLLYKGDQVWIPLIAPKEFEAAVDQKHKYVLYPPKTTLLLFLQDDDGHPHGDVKYEVWISGERYGSGEKKTRKDGLVFEQVPLVDEVELRVWFPVPKKGAEDNDEAETEGVAAGKDFWPAEAEGDFDPDDLEVREDAYESIVVQLRHLDPFDTVEGVQDRLNNLGYSCGDEKGTMGPKTEQAIREFQSDCSLTETGTIDMTKGQKDLTLKALSEMYHESTPASGGK